ncbi:thioredoxin family protein [Clostridium fallax]|uniref:Thioredoxin n=1 Tax=Clostridium fallax TaxID=1533 RepID=A0A1M4YTR7_9CLOT|nr:thioredoxin family protein [Clostridium fallax]SHF09224.1 hypothetical protein SAMN05443638_1327 [Clostridium fallax]SQB22183.1 thioredoxin [Clostridium fallax]
MQLNNLKEVDSFINSNKICFLYFNKENSGCCVCNVLYTKLLDLQKTNKDVKVGLILDKPDIFNYFNVYSTPFTIMFVEGKEVLKEGAYLSIDEVKSILERLTSLM